MWIRLREPFNALTHLIGAFLAAIGIIWLAFIAYPDTPALTATIVYGLSVVFCLGSSGVMHSYSGDRRILRWLVRLDHAAIYVMIAGTYTPFVWVYFDGGVRLFLLLTIWGLALAGVFWKVAYWQQDSLVSVLLYIIMGWAAVMLAPFILPRIPLSITLCILGGGIVYSVGAVVFHLRQPNFGEWLGFHEIWHLFVLGGCALHFIAITLIFL